MATSPKLQTAIALVAVGLALSTSGASAATPSAAMFASTADLAAKTGMTREQLAGASGLSAEMLDEFVRGAQEVGNLNLDQLAAVIVDPKLVAGTAVRSVETTSLAAAVSTDTPVRYTDADGETVQTGPGDVCVGSCSTYSQSLPAAAVPSASGLGSGSVSPSGCTSTDTSEDCADANPDSLYTAKTTTDNPNVEFQQLETQSLATVPEGPTRGAPVNKIASGCHNHQKKNQIQTFFGTDLVRIQVTISYCWTRIGDVYGAFVRSASRDVTAVGGLNGYSLQGSLNTPAPDLYFTNNGHANGAYRAWRQTTYKRTLPKLPDPVGDLNVRAYGYGDGRSG